jgi:hypothetical protein
VLPSTWKFFPTAHLTRVDQHSPELCRLVNDALDASAQRDPTRFKALAHLPFNDMGAMMA